jgi:hypothetical protein
MRFGVAFSNAPTRPFATIFWKNGKPLDDNCLYIEKGVPKPLFGAMGIDKRKPSMNVAVPLKPTP